MNNYKVKYKQCPKCLYLNLNDEKDNFSDKCRGCKVSIKKVQIKGSFKEGK